MDPAEHGPSGDGAASGAGRSMQERMLAGELYLADDPEIQAASEAAVALMTAYNATGAGAPADARRRELLEQLLGAIGADTVLRPPLYVD